MKEIIMKAKAFRNDGPRTYRMAVEDDGTVLVWDSVAKHFTTCHSLSKHALKRARRLANDIKI